jgi:p-aminobenzoyl-glutamate transporter AbgT
MLATTWVQIIKAVLLLGGVTIMALLVLATTGINFSFANLAGSGLLLDMTAKTYLDQLFGSTSYFQDGFTYMVAILFITAGLAYGIGAKTIKNDRDLIEKTSDTFKDLGMVLLMIFVFSQFITVWKQSNIGIVFTSWCANLLSHLEFDGIPLIVITIIIISICRIGIFHRVT